MCQKTIIFDSAQVFIDKADELLTYALNAIAHKTNDQLLLLHTVYRQPLHRGKNTETAIGRGNTYV